MLLFFKKEGLSPTRNGGLDALRAALTLLVLFHHTAITYGGSGGWFYREVETSGAPSSVALTFLCAIDQSYFMGLFFLIAGYFTPASFRRHGAWGYLRERAVRLGIPLVVFILLIGPATAALADTADGDPFIGALLAIWRRGIIINGPLWFAQALLMFAVAYVVSDRLAARSQLRQARAFPSNLALALAAFGTGATAFLLRLQWPLGANVFGLQLGFFASYIVLFVAGCAGAEAKWWETIPPGQRRLWGVVAWCAAPVLPLAFLLTPPAHRHAFAGGWTWQAFLYAFWEPLVAWGIILALLAGFHRRFATLGPTWSALSRRAYAIYVIHPPVLVALALAWRGVHAPNLVKFAVTGTATCLVCYAVAGVLQRVPLVRRVL